MDDGNGALESAVRMARVEALEDAVNIIQRFSGWGLGYDNCTALLVKQIRAEIDKMPVSPS